MLLHCAALYCVMLLIHYFVAWCGVQVARSYVVDTKTGISKLDPIRTSYGAAIM
jgi:hypothetical protein